MAIPSMMVGATPTVSYWNGSSWVDISSHVKAYSYTSGRTDETSGVSPGQATLTLDNNDGTFVSATGPVNLLPSTTLVRINAASSARYTGKVIGSPLTFNDPDGLQSTVTINLVDALADLQRHVLSTTLEETISAATTTVGVTGAWWPCDDSSSTQLREGLGLTTWGPIPLAANELSNYPAIMGVGGPGFQQSSCAQAPALGCDYINPYPGSFDITNGLAVGMFFKIGISTLGFARFGTNLSGASNSNPGDFWISADSTPALTFSVNDATGMRTATVTAAFTPDSQWHSLLATVDATGATKLYLDDTLAASASSVSGWTTSNALSLGEFFGISASPLGGGLVSFGNLILVESPSFIPLHQGSLSFAGQSSAAALQQLATWATPPTSQSFDAQTVAVGPSNGVQVAGSDAMSIGQLFSTSEDGPLYVKRDGTLANLTHRTLADHAMAPPAAAFVNGDVEPDLMFARDHQYLVTHLEVTPQSGSGVLKVFTNNVPTFGRYDDSKTLALNDTAAIDYGNWHIGHSSSVDYSRISQVSIDFLNGVDIQAVALGIDIGSRITLAGLPVLGGYTSADLIVQGFTENWDINHWLITFNTTPSVNYVCWVLEDAVYGLLDQTTILYY